MKMNRLTQPKDWAFVRSEDMIADIGNQRVSDLDAVGMDSVWIIGFDWMKWDKASFPAETIDEIKLNSEEISALENEILKYSSEMAKDLMANKVDKSYLISDVYERIAVDIYQRKISSEVLECFKFSKYVRHSFLGRQTTNFTRAHIVPHLKFTRAPFKTPK